MTSGRFRVVAAIALTAMAAHGAADTRGEEQRFLQDRFAIGFWVDPPADRDMDGRYAEMARARFSLVIASSGAVTRDAVSRQLELCGKYGLKAIVATTGLDANQLPEGLACWGYLLRDEPNAKDFPALRATVDAIRKARPGRLAYINLFPNYATPEQLGTSSYEEYVTRFADEVNVDVLSMDHYPVMRPDADGREGYCSNLDVMRKVSLARGIPFWNFFNTMPFGPHADPTEAQINWQIYTSLAYGAKGVMYFCYWTPRGSEFPKGGAIITAEGRRTRHYDQAMRINDALRRLGPALMKLTSTAVYRVRPKDDPAAVLKDSPIRSLTPGDYLVGVFRQADGRRAVLINNYDFAYTQWPTVAFDTEPGRVSEVSPRTGQAAPVVDDSPAMEGLQLAIDAGVGRLFLLPSR